MDKASILAYYSIFSSFFLLIFFAYFAGHWLAEPGHAVASLYPLAPEFIERVVPGFFHRAAVLAGQVGNLGLASIAIFLVMGALIFRKVIQYINEMFHITARKGFFLKRLEEFALLVVVMLLTGVSFAATAFIQLITSVMASGRSRLRLSPAVLRTVDSVLVKYLVPFLIACLLFFLLYKWIPEKRVCTRGAVWAAVICAALWEGAKRSYTYYLVHFSLLGRMQGSIITIILFGFWMEINMGIMLFGAKLTHLLDQEAECSA